MLFLEWQRNSESYFYALEFAGNFLGVTFGRNLFVCWDDDLDWIGLLYGEMGFCGFNVTVIGCVGFVIFALLLSLGILKHVSLRFHS